MKTIVFTIVSYFFSFTLIAQTIKGKVVNNQNQPLQEVNILNKKTDKHTHSDEFGNFMLENVSIGDTLYFSHIGFESRSYVVKKLDGRIST